MRPVLIDILHPAHVHFFRNAITDLRRSGVEVLVTARDKDLTVRLLDLYGIEHRVLSREARGLPGLATELVTRNLALLRLVRRHRPSAMASIGGVSTAQVGFLTRTRNFIFYDTEHATLSNLISYPLATEVVTPDCYRGRVLGHHVTYPGYHELAYLHPSRFRPDPQVLRDEGVDPEAPFSVVRFVSWKAVHDTRARGLSADDRRRLVGALARHGRVLVSSETPLPDDLEPYRLALRPDRVHHLLAFARLFVGESATMASESVVLGTPAIYVDPTGRGYTTEQEQRYGLCSNFLPTEGDGVLSRTRQVLADDLKEDATFQAGWQRLLREKIDVTSLMVSKLSSTS